MATSLSSSVCAVSSQCSRASNLVTKTGGPQSTDELEEKKYSGKSRNLATWELTSFCDALMLSASYQLMYVLAWEQSVNR